LENFKKKFLKSKINKFKKKTKNKIKVNKRKIIFSKFYYLENNILEDLENF
jgi:hypothetical protein